jgi:HlyD family secretion protein
MLIFKKKFIIIATLIIVVGIAGIILFTGKGKTSYDFAIVSRGAVIEEVSATGTVKPADDVDLRFETSGTVEKIYVKEGSFVKQGAYLVKLNTGKLYSQFLQTQASYNEAKAKLDKFLVGTTTEEIQVAEQVVDNARIALDDAKTKAENDLDEKYDDALVYLSNASSKTNIALADLENFEPKYFQDTSSVATIFKDKKSVARIAFFGTNGAKTVVTNVVANPIQANIDNALIVVRSSINKTKDVVDYTREAMSSPTLREDVTTTDQTTIDTDITNISAVLTDISTAQQAIASQKVTNQTNINSAENTLKKAEDDLAETKAVPREVDIAVYKADVDKTKASMVELQQKLDDAVLRAPIDAIIAKVNIKIGETVTAGGNPIVSLISHNNFEIDVDVPETDIGKVHLGDTAVISLDAFSEELWPAKVVEIEPAETVIESVVYYKIKVVFDKIDERIKSGMTADITIQTSKKDNVLFVPLRAVAYKQDKKVVRILENEKIKEVEVVTGVKGSNGEIEILSGLNEGEKIVTFIKND